MFPNLGDDNSDRTITPYVNYLFIAVKHLGFRVFAANRQQ